MAYDVEDKVVQMRFDNRDFDPNIDASIKSLEKLEAALKFDKATEGINNLQKSVNKFSLSNLASEFKTEFLEGLTQFEVVGRTVLYRVTNTFLNSTSKLFKTLFITPISTGWQEYGQQMNSTQVIMANTGDEIGRVTQSLDQLNEYADKTVYSFGQMTAAIGKFAAASVDLDSSVEAIKGLSNAAALVGASDANLSSAYYNLSQALQLGALTAIDWRPLQYSMIGTKTMQKVFIETAIAMGKFTRDSEQAQKAMTDFKGSLSSKWLDKDVIVNGLKVYSLNIEELTKQVDSATGEIYYLNKEGEKIPEWMAKLGTSATKAATEIKNLQQLWDVLKEEAQTGWADNWKIIIGDLNEAKELWTNVGNRVTSILHTINDAIKGVIQSWRDNGDRDTLISALEKSLDNLRIGLSIFFRVLNDIIPITNEKISKLTNNLNDMASVLHLDKDEAESLYKILSIITIPLQVIARVIMLIYNVGYFVITSVIEGVKIILDIISIARNNISLILDAFGITEDKIVRFAIILNNFKRILITIINLVIDFALHSLKLIFPVVQSLGKLIFTVFKIIFNAISKISEIDTGWFSNLLNILYSGLSLVANIIVIIAEAINDALNNGLGDAIVSIVGILGILLNVLSKIASIVTYVVTGVLQKIAPLLSSISNLLFTVVDSIFKLLSGLLNFKFDNSTEFLDTLINGLANAINFIGIFIEYIVSLINNVASLINGKDWNKIGFTILSSFQSGFSKAMPAVTDTVNQFGQGIISDVSDTLQVHSPSPLFIKIGGWIPKSIAMGMDEESKEVEKSSNGLLDVIGKVFNRSKMSDSAEKSLETWDESVSKTFDTINKTMFIRLGIVAAAIAAATVLIAILMSKIPNLNNVFKDLGSNMRGMVTTFQSVGNSIKGLLDSFGKSIRSKATAEIIKSIGISLLLLASALTMLTITFYNTDNDSFAKMLTTLAFITSIMIALTVISSMIARKESQFKSLSKVTVALQSILWSLTLLIISMSILSSTNINKDVIDVLQTVGLIAGGLLSLTMIFAMFTKNNDIKQIVMSTSLVNGIINSLSSIIIMLKFLADSSIDSDGISKIILALAGSVSLLSILCLIITKNIGNKEGVYKKLITSFVIISALIAELGIIVKSLKNIGNLKFDNNVNFIILSLTSSIMLLSILAVNIIKEDKNIGKSLAGMFIIDNAIAGIIILIQAITLLNDKNFNARQIIAVLVSISLVVTELAILSSIIIDEYKNIGKSLAGMLIIHNAIAGLIPLIQAITLLNNKNFNARQIVVVLGSISLVVTELSVLSRIIIGKYKNIGKSLAGMLVIHNAIAGLIPLIQAMLLLNKAKVSYDTVKQLSLISAIVTALSVVVSHLVVTDNNNIGKAMIGILAYQLMTANIIALMDTLYVLNKVNINSDNTIKCLGYVSGIIAILTMIVTKLTVTNYSDIGKAMIGILAYQFMTADMVVLMTALKQLNSVNISYKTVDQLILLSTIIAALTAIGALIGKGTYYTAIGAAAIIAISGALLIAAEALKRFSSANIDNLNNGFERFRDILSGNWGNFLKTIGALLALSALVPILSLLAPAIDLVSIGIYIISESMINASTAIHQFISDIKELAITFGNVTNTIVNNVLNYDALSNLITLFKDNISDIAQGIKDLSGGIALMGAAFGAVAIGFSLLLPFAFLFIKFLDQISNVFNKFIANIDKVTNSINKLSNNADNIDKLLTSIEKHLNEFKLLISSLFIGGFIDRGRTFKTYIISLAQAFAIASVGVIRFGLGLMSIGKGLLWLSAGVLVAKAILGEDLNNIITTVRNNISKLIEKFGALKASIIISSRITSFITAISAVAFWLGYIGNRLKVFGSGLIRTAVGALLFAFSMKKIAEGLLYIQQTDPLNIIGGIIASVISLVAIAFLLGPLTPLFKGASAGLKSISVGLIMFSGALMALSYVMNVAQNYISYFWDLFSLITVFSLALGTLAVPAILAGVALGTLGAGLTIVSIGLAGLVGVLALANNTVGGMSGLWSLFGFVVAITAALGALAVPALLAGVGIGTLGAGLVILSIGLLAMVGILALFGKVVSESELLQSIFENMSGIINNFKNSIAKILLDVATFFTSFFPEFKNQLIENFEQIGWWIPESIRNGIESAITTVCDAAANVANNIESTIRNILDIHSESPKLFDIGKWVPLSIADGENSFAQKAWDGAKSVATGIWDTIDKITNGRARQSVSNIKNKLGNLKNTITKIFNFKNKNGLFGGIADKLSNLDFGKWLNVDSINFDKIDFGSMTDGLDNVTSGLGNVGSAASTTKGTLEELTDTIKNQMKIFERFNDEDIMDPKELIHNMESQIKGITNWANGIDILAARGASAGLIQYLSEMGPEGYKYVESFLEMTEDQFNKANSLFVEGLSLPDQAANTLLDGYRKSGAEIVEAATEAANGAAGGIGSAFEGVKTQIIDGSTEIGKKVVSEAIDKGELTATTIRELAGEAGRAGELYFAPELNRWLSSDEFQQMKDQLQSVYKFNAGDLMDQFAKAKPTNKVDTSHTIFDHDYLRQLSENDGVFYLDGFGEALSSSQYIAKCMEKGGQLLPAVIDESVKPADLGERMGKTCVEWAAMSIEDGSSDLADAMENSFDDAIDESSGGIWDLIEEFIDDITSEEADLYEEAATTKLTSAITNSWSSAMEKDKTYQKKMQDQYDQWYQNAYGKSSNYTKGLVDGQNDSKITAELKNAAKKNANIVDKTTKEGLKENSPSELAEEDGMYWVIGIANGLNNYAYLLEKASNGLTDKPINALSDTINSISNMFTDDIDAEPTIRPVIDMSNIDANADKLDTLFSTQQATIAANAQVRYSHDDSISKLKAAYADVINNANAQLVMAIQKSEQPVNVNVTLQGDASTFFKAMVDQTRQTVSTGANNPFLITNRNGINAALI